MVTLQGRCVGSKLCRKVALQKHDWKPLLQIIILCHKVKGVNLLQNVICRTI